MCPAIGLADGRRFALGASGGRRILPAVLQMASFLLDHGMNLEDAFHQPRLDVSGPDLVTADERLPFAIEPPPGRRLPPPAAPARARSCSPARPPSSTTRASGWREGMTEPMHPWADAVAEA